MQWNGQEKGGISEVPSNTNSPATLKQRSIIIAEKLKEKEHSVMVREKGDERRSAAARKNR